MIIILHQYIRYNDVTEAVDEHVAADGDDDSKWIIYTSSILSLLHKVRLCCKLAHAHVNACAVNVST